MLSDGVVYASKDLSADIILDRATLTGAQVGHNVRLGDQIHFQALYMCLYPRPLT